MATVIPVHKYKVRFWTEDEGVRVYHETSTIGASPTAAILRATRPFTELLFGEPRRGHVVSVVRFGK